MVLSRNFLCISLLVCCSLSTPILAGVSGLWSNSSSRITLNSAAAAFNITATGLPAASANSTQLRIFSDSNCITFINTLTASGAVQFLANTRAYADATSVYSIINNGGTTPENVFSIQVTPYAAGVGAIFSPALSCFNVACSAGQCIMNPSRMVDVSLTT